MYLFVSNVKNNKSIILFCFAFLMLAACLIGLFCIDLPVPESQVREVLPIDHKNKCLIKQIS